MSYISINDFESIVNTISIIDKESLRKIYSGWATGQPFSIKLEYYKFFLSGFSNFERIFNKYLNKLKKGNDGKINFIVGEFGSGKTQLLNYLASLAKEKYGFGYLYYSLEDSIENVEHLLSQIESEVNKRKGKYILFLDHVEAGYWRSERPIEDLNTFLSTLNAMIGGHLGNKVLSVVLAINREWFELLKRYKTFRGKGNYKIHTLVDISRGQELFIEHMMDSSAKLLALHYILSYYKGFREKILKHFDDITRFAHDMILRISRFGVRSIGLGLKMLNDRLVDFIKYIADETEKTNKSEMELAKEVVLTYLEKRFKDIVLTFDRPWGFSLYEINFRKNPNGSFIGYLEIKSLNKELINKAIRGKIALFVSSSTNIKEAEKTALSNLKNNGFVSVIHFFKKKKGIREEIEKIYLKNSSMMGNFTIIPIDLNILKFTYKLKPEGFSVFVEKNTTAKRDIEETINSFINIKLLQHIKNIPKEEQGCEHIVLALFLWAQSWLSKSGFCRVKKRSLETVKMFFVNLFPPSIMNIDRNNIIKKLIAELEKDRIIYIRGRDLIISDRVNDEVVLKKIVKVARKLFC